MENNNNNETPVNPSQSLHDVSNTYSECLSIINDKNTYTRNNMLTELYNNLDNIKKNGVTNLIFRDITNQPKTLEIQYISLIKENYCVTEKKDGQRCLLFKSDLNNKFYLVNHNLQFELIKTEEEIELGITLLDCEYIPENNNIIILNC